MADTYEKDLAQKSTLTTSDYIRVVGSDNVSYKQLVSSVANATGSAYLGAFSASSDEDAVKQALSALKTKYSSESSSTENLPKVVSFMRSGAWGFVGVAWIRSTTVEMTAVRYTDGVTYFGKDVSNTQTVTTQPTRAEVDALTNRKMIRYLVTIPSITIGSGGYTSISSYYPGAQTGYSFLTAVCYNFGSISPASAFTVLGNSNYVAGQPNATITNLQIAYIYAPAVEARP